MTQKSFASLLLTLAVASCQSSSQTVSPVTAQAPSAAPAQPAEPAALPATALPTCTLANPENIDSVLDDEQIGGLGLGDSAKKAVTLLGVPVDVDEEYPNEVDGGFTRQWKHSNGITLNIWTEKSEKNPDAQTEKGSVGFITVNSPSQAKTRYGIGIGATRSQVLAAYGDCISAEEQNGDSESVLAGTVYGGVLFSMRDGKVESIDVGAMAE